MKIRKDGRFRVQGYTGCKIFKGQVSAQSEVVFFQSWSDLSAVLMLTCGRVTSTLLSSLVPTMLASALVTCW